jgi:hypothetical protein
MLYYINNSFYSIQYYYTTPLPLFILKKSVLMVEELVEKMYFSDYREKNHVC